MLRTQIYLPEDLVNEIDKHRSLSGESRAGYLRKAAEKRLEAEKKRKANLKKLAEELGSRVKKSGWEGIDVLKWQREIRKDRKIL